MSSDEFPKIAGFRGNLFEDFAHRELQNGGTFRIRCLNNDNSECCGRCILWVGEPMICRVGVFTDRGMLPNLTQIATLTNSDCLYD